MPSASTPNKRSSASSSTQPTKRRRVAKSQSSVWNTPDDWDQLVADSALSTASVSSRRPRPRGLQSLVKCATDASARGFRRLWEDRAGMTSDGRGGVVRGGVWKDEWEWVPDHLKVGVREGVYRYWGAFLTADMITEVFAVAPVLLLPAATLPALTKATHLKPFRPPEDHLDTFISLVLTHAASAADVAVAGLIHYMPRLEVINLKGCSLVGEKTVKTVLKRCPNIKRLNLKGTNIKEAEVKALLDRFGNQLEGFKVDRIQFSNVNETFASLPYPVLTHLCLPGDILNAPSREFANRARRLGHNVAHAAPKPTPENSIFDWPTLRYAFPHLTHLYLPGLFLPPDTSFGIPPNTLRKVSFGQGGPAVPVGPLTELMASQIETLRAVHIGHILPQGQNFKLGSIGVEEEFNQLGEALGRCETLEDFRLDCGSGSGTGDVRTDQAMSKFSTFLLQGLKGRWRSTLKHLALNIPQFIELDVFLPDVPDVICPVMERLELPSVGLWTDFADAIKHFRRLRSLDLSGTTITDEGVFKILDHCPLLSRIDLTSCRGVKVQHRRNIFKAWEEERAEET